MCYNRSCRNPNSVPCANGGIQCTATGTTCNAETRTCVAVVDEDDQGDDN
jgi:hypothetical protein